MPSRGQAVHRAVRSSNLPQWLAFTQNAVSTAVLYVMYQFSRGLVPRSSAQAINHAQAVWGWEVAHGLFVEPAWQRFWLARTHELCWVQITPAWMAGFLNMGYLYVHFVGTVLFLAWLFCCRRVIFPFVRNLFFVTTSIALLIYNLYPMAPPRLTPHLLYERHPYVFVDTIARILGPGSQAAGFGYNPYAAMPSLHFAWSLIIGCTLSLTLRPWPLRFLSLGYPAYILLVIVVSGNHYFADVLASGVVVSMATAILAGGSWWRRRLQARG